MAGVETAAMNSTDVSLAAFDGQQVLWTVAANTLLHEVGVPLPMTPTVLVAGANAVSGTFDPFLAILAIVAVVAATLIGNSLWFAAGRRYGMGGLKQLGRFAGSSDAFISRAESAVGRWGGSSLVVGRFVPGVSLVAPPLAGALGMRWSKFLMLTTAGASLYGVVVVTAGMLLHRQITSALLQLEDFGWYALAAAIAAVVILYVASRWRRRTRETGFGQNQPLATAL